MPHTLCKVGMFATLNDWNVTLHKAFAAALDKVEYFLSAFDIALWRREVVKKDASYASSLVAVLDAEVLVAPLLEACVLF